MVKVSAMVSIHYLNTESWVKMTVKSYYIYKKLFYIFLMISNTAIDETWG